MDISDGLATDLPRLCRASGTGAVVDPAQIPYHPAIAKLPARRDYALAAGDDYQLLIALAPEAKEEAARLATAHDTLLSAIGRLTEPGQVRLVDGPWPRPGFQHFPTALDV